MTENDYIAEYIKEKYPTLLGLDFAFWKMGKMVVNAGNRIAKTFNNVDWSKFTFSNWFTIECPYCKTQRHVKMDETLEREKDKMKRVGAEK